jgi:hypothetical protein
MEQINFIKEDDDIYALTIFYNYNLYELKISASDLDSDIIEIDYLDEIIQQGLRPNQVKKIDEHLSVKTLIEEDLDQKILKLNIHLVFKKGKLKSTSEKHTLILRQKIIDTQHTFENVMRGTISLTYNQIHSISLFTFNTTTITSITSTSTINPSTSSTNQSLITAFYHTSSSNSTTSQHSIRTNKSLRTLSSNSITISSSAPFTLTTFTLYLQTISHTHTFATLFLSFNPPNAS